MAKKKRVKKQKIKTDLLRIAVFVILDALVFHEALASYKREVHSLRFTPSADITSFLDLEWRKIMRIDYIPIFSLAHRILLSFPTSPNTEAILKQLIHEALKIVSSGVLLKHDLMGRIYHRLLLRTTGGYYATYYTSIPAAWILANLTVKTPNPNLHWGFGRVQNIKKLKIIDPACGSGTLLSAAYSAVKDSYILSREEGLNLKDLHTSLLENVLYGWDILDYAAHLTLTTLAFHNYRASFSQTNICTLPVGIGSMREIHLGSLDYLLDQKTFKGKGFTLPATEKNLSGAREVLIEPPECDIVIMNPPFSRSAGTVNIKFGYTKKETMDLLNKELRKMGNKMGFTGIGQAGLGAYFILLGDRLLKKGGRISTVIPRAILSGVSWIKIRNKLLKHYEMEFIISNHDPGNPEEGVEPWNFSENTDLGEILMVARKTHSPIENKITTIINLWNKPKNEVESLIIANRSMAARKRKDLMFFEEGTYEVLKLTKALGTVYNVSQKYLKYNFLFPVLFAHPDLNKFVFKLLNNSVFPLCPVKQITQQLGIDRKQIHVSFKKVQHSTPFKVAWSYPKSLNTLELPDQFVGYGLPTGKKATSLFNHAGVLLVAGTLYTASQSIISTFSPKPILANVFWEIQTNEKFAKLLTVWLNSTFGLMLYLSASISSVGSTFNLKKDQLSNLFVLDVSKLSKSRINLLVQFFEKNRSRHFLSFPDEFNLASKGQGLRKEIDDYIVMVLGLNIDLQPYYEMLSKEPIITLRRL